MVSFYAPLIVTAVVALLVLQGRPSEAQIQSPLLQIWGINLAGTRPLTPAEILGADVRRVQPVAFDPDEGNRLRASYESRYGPGGQRLIDELGQGRHVDEAARKLNEEALLRKRRGRRVSRRH